MTLAELKSLIRDYAEAVHRIDFDRTGVLRFRRFRRSEASKTIRRRDICYFLDDYQDQFEEVQATCDALCTAMGYTTRASYCQGSLQTEGACVPRHCDGTDVVILQLIGTRRWRVEPNTDPPKGIRALVRLPQKLRRGWSSEFGPDSHTVALRPGSALYVPRGCWHETRSVGTSFSLTIGITPRGR